MASDWQAILLRGLESKDLDYKGPCAWDEKDKRACCEITKDILGMANTDGGYIIVGVAEEQGSFNWVGLSEEQLATWDTTRVNRFVQTYADPPINATLISVEHNGSRFVIIEVPGFRDTPHVCQKDFPDTLRSPSIYVRTDNNETAPLRSSSDFRAIVERSVRNRFDQLLASFRSILTGPAVTAHDDRELFEQQRAEAIAQVAGNDPYKEKSYAGYHQCVAWPTHFERDRFSIATLRQAAEKSTVDYRGWPFLPVVNGGDEPTYAIQDGVQTIVRELDLRGDDTYDFWQLRSSGLFFHQALMTEESQARRNNLPAFAAVSELTAYIAEAVDCVARLYTALEVQGEDISVQVTMLGTQGRVLRETEAGRRTPLRGLYKCEIPTVFVDRTAPLEEWRAARVDISAELAVETFQRFNWPNPLARVIRDRITKLFERQF